MKHTPSPWKAEKCNCNHHQHICPDYVIITPHNSDGRFSQADATLICAAPEMYRELKKLSIYVKAMIERLHEIDPQFWGDGKSPAILSTTQQIIKSIEGT